MEKPWVLGISASHNGGACLLYGDRIVVAVQEERLCRIKRATLFGGRSSLAVEYCLSTAGIGADKLDLVVLCAQRSNSSDEQDLTTNPQLRVAANGTKTLTISHHFGHAMSAFALSGFKESAILVVDGLGSPAADLSADERTAVVENVENGWEGTSLYYGSGVSLHALEKHLVPNALWITKDPSGMPRFGSLGGMYSAVASQIFGNPMEAGKVMGLAPYGEATFGSEEFFKFDGRCFRFLDSVPNQFRHTDRWPKHEREYQNLARSTQGALEVAILYLAAHLRELSGCRNLCYSGGVALNCIINERLIRESGFEAVFIPPAAEDSGPAIGAAYYGLWHLTGENTLRTLPSDSMGRTYSACDIEEAARQVPAIVSKKCLPDEVLDQTVKRLCAGEFGGWFQGGSEFGPRALGQRSILADPRCGNAKSMLNSRVKFREPFRPFAPAVLEEKATEWFELDGVHPDSPFMLRVCPLKSQVRNLIPAVVHVDGTGRLQTVSEEHGGKFHALLRRFYDVTGVPLLLNTSFNGPEEPIVETPEDALWCMLQNDLDFVVLEDRIMVREHGLHSILDLFPTIVADSYSVEIPLEEGRFSSEVPGTVTLMFNMKTRWGLHKVPVYSYLSSLLRLIDGQANGWTLKDRLSDSLEIDIDRVTFKQALGALKRASVITFQKAPGRNDG